MSTPASAVTTVASASTTEQVPASLPELSSLTPEQRAEWRTTGELPPSKQDSAPAKKENAAPESAPDKKEKPAVSASDSATDKEAQQPHRKTKEDTEKRFQELLDRVKKAEDRAEAAERAKTTPSEKRDVKQESQPAAEEKYKRPDEKKWFGENPGKTYEDYIDTCIEHRAQWEQKGTDQKIEKALATDRQRRQQEVAATELRAKVADAEQRYGKDEAAKIFPAVDKIVSDPQIPAVIKAMLDRSDVLVDLAYTIGSDSAEFEAFLKTCKSDPGAALEKLVTVQALVREQLKANSGKSASDRGADGKFQKTGKEDAADKSGEDKSGKADKEAAAQEPITRATRPPLEIGGRQSASEDAAGAAVKSNDFRAAKAAFDRDYAASHKL